MKLYPLPGGLWAGTEADFKKQCKARGIDAKTLPGSREVPVAKADLIEFLNFYAVDVYRTGAGTEPDAAPDTVVDVEALRAEHNPLAKDAFAHEQENIALPQTNADRPMGAGADDSSTATRQLAAMDNPGVDVDAIVETICNAKGHMLKRFAGAVAAAFSALA